MTTETDIMALADYLAQGGKLTSPENVPPRYRAELMRLMSSFVDSALAGSAGFADAINKAPGIKERIAASRITLEKADHAERVLALMAEFGTDVSRYNAAHDWAARVGRDEDIGARRHGGDMRLSVFHYPLQGWADAVTMNVLMGTASVIHLEEMALASYSPLAEVLRELLPRERRHLELGLEGLERLVGTARGAVGAALAYWHPKVSQTFGPETSERYDRLRAMGLRHHPNADLRQRWQSAVESHLQGLGLGAP